MSKVWGLHMPEEIGSAALDGNYVAIGWPDLKSLEKVEGGREAFKEAILTAYPSRKPGAVPVEAGILYRFSNEVRAGDWVIYPSKHNREVNIGRFQGQYSYVPTVNGECNNYPNRHAVDWLNRFSRSEFSQAALNEIGSFITLFSVRKHATEFLNKVTPQGELPTESEDDQTPDDDSVTSIVSRQAQETTQDYVIRKIYDALSGYEFEEFTAHLLECMGYTARVTTKSGDGGVDVIAHSDELGFEPPIIKVQCKRMTSQIGEPEVNQLLGTLGEGECALFISLGSYSRPARLLERNRPKLRLIDGEQLVELVLEHYDKLSARFRTMIPLKQIYVPDIMISQD
ncbi:restriction endonuclease [Polycladidibacter stylochi]|uniref:restriction endonuclease n=1 Tax=Polycladidibacter stylochi TaxID=1807766 RepID=UPI000AE39FB5|nr:restriction endonuclease [Pseudovibrio stylochi]